MEIDEIKNLLKKDNIKTFLRKPSANLYGQIVKYVFSGGLAFLIDAGAMILLKEAFGVYYLYASVAGFVIGLVFTYLASVFWIFDVRKVNNARIEFLIFALIGLVGLGLTWFFMQIFTSVFAVYYVFSKVLTALIVSAWNFIAKKNLLFRH